MSFPFHVFSGPVVFSTKKEIKKVTKDVATSFDFKHDNTDILNKVLDSGFYCNQNCVNFLFKNSDKFGRYNINMLIIVYNLMDYCMINFQTDELRVIRDVLFNGTFISYLSYLKVDTDDIPLNILENRIDIQLEIYRDILLGIIKS